MSKNPPYERKPHIMRKTDNKEKWWKPYKEGVEIIHIAERFGVNKVTVTHYIKKQLEGVTDVPS